MLKADVGLTDKDITMQKKQKQRKQSKYDAAFKASAARGKNTNYGYGVYESMTPA